MGTSKAGARLLGGWLRSLENRLVFRPGRGLAATPADYHLPYWRAAFRAADGVQLMAWVIPREAAAPWILYFHGNARNISHYLPLTTRLHASGFNVLMPEYRGYGESEGIPSEQGLYLDAAAAYAYVRGLGVAASDLVVYGYSLGTGVAVQLAAHQDIAALVLEAPFTSIPAVAKATVPFVPRCLLRNDFDSLSRIAGIGAPKLFIHAMDDRTVPFRQGRALYDVASAPKRFLEVSGGHTVMLQAKPPPDALEALQELVLERRQNQPSS